MAEFNSYLLGKARKSVGNITLCYTRRKNIAKAKVFSRNGNTSNAFVAMNMQAVTVDEKHVATVNFDRLKVASGILYTPKVTVTYDEEGQVYSFVQEIQEEENGYAFVDDQVYGVLYETVLERAKIVTLRTRGESGTTIFSLPEDWDHANVKAYCFATLKSGKEVSDSRKLEL